MDNDKLEWLDDEPLQCAFFPTAERCGNQTKMIAFGANDAGTFCWFPICSECAMEQESHDWQVAQPFGMHEADLEMR